VEKNGAFCWQSAQWYTSWCQFRALPSMQSHLSRCFPRREAPAPLDAEAAAKAVAKKNEQDERQKVQEEQAPRKKCNRLEKTRAAGFRNAIFKKETPEYPYPYNASSCTSSESAAAPASAIASLPADSDQNQIAPLPPLPPPPASVVSQANHNPQLIRDPAASIESLPRLNPQEHLAPSVKASQQFHPQPSASPLKAAAPASAIASLPADSDQKQIAAPPPPPASVVSQANHNPQLIRDPAASIESLPRLNPQEHLAPSVKASQQFHPQPSASPLKDDVRIRQSTRQLLADTAANSKFMTARVSSSDEGMDAIQFTPLNDEYRVSLGRNHRQNTAYPTSSAQPSPIRAQPLQGDLFRSAGLASQIPAPTLAAGVTEPAPLPYSSPNEQSAPISSAPHRLAPHETPPLEFQEHHTPPAERHAPYTPPYSNGNLKQLTVDFTGKVAQFLSQQDAFTAQNSAKPPALQHSPAPLFGAAPIKAASPKSPRDAARSKIQATV
jgi:hypothetical protein